MNAIEEVVRAEERVQNEQLRDDIQHVQILHRHVQIRDVARAESAAARRDLSVVVAQLGLTSSPLSAPPAHLADDRRSFARWMHVRLRP